MSFPAFPHSSLSESEIKKLLLKSVESDGLSAFELFDAQKSGGKCLLAPFYGKLAIFPKTAWAFYLNSSFYNFYLNSSFYNYC